MKRNLITVLFALTSFYSQAQSSYQESFDAMEVAFMATFSASETPGITQKFIISAKDDYEVSAQMGPFKTLELVLEKAFDLAECEQCEKVEETTTNTPLEFIYKNIEYQDVYFVEKYKKGFKVIRYQPKEEEE